MPYTYTRWAYSETLSTSTKPTGIWIATKANNAPYQGLMWSGDLSQFATEVKRNLVYIYKTTTGRNVLNYLNECTRTVFIDPAMYGMGYFNMPGGNPCKDVVHIVESSSKRQLFGLFNVGNIDITKFINNFYLIPEYKQDSTPVFSWNQFRERIQKQNFTPGIVREEASALDWISNKISQTPAKILSKQHLINSLILTLYDFSSSSTGTNVTVMFNEAETDELNIQERPSAIGLAHELIHAYYSVRGLQPSAPDALLDDLICIGLGSWTNEPITDNRIRSEWNTSAYNIVPSKDVANKKKVGLRTSHADIGLHHPVCILM